MLGVSPRALAIAVRHARRKMTQAGFAAAIRQFRNHHINVTPPAAHARE
jgi:hypothetical protein